jgi:hypothetical protein
MYAVVYLIECQILQSWESNFGIVLDFRYLTTEFALAKEYLDQSKIGVFLSIFMPSFTEMSFGAQKREKKAIK